MPGIVFDEIEAYIERLANRGDAALQAIEEQGRKEDWPIVGAAEGSLPHYLDVLPHCISKLRVGGLLVTDNVLWSGRVAKARRTKEAEVIHEYNEKLAADPRFVVVIVPLRDGVSIAHKVRD